MMLKRLRLLITFTVCVFAFFYGVKIFISDNSARIDNSSSVSAYQDEIDAGNYSEKVTKRRDEKNNQQAQSHSSPIKQQSAISEVDKQRIFTLLKKIKQDQKGDVIVGHHTLLMIDGALGYNALSLDDQGLENFLQSIIDKFGENAGKQIAALIGNYYHFLEARKELDARYVGTKNIQRHKLHFNELVRLREKHLGLDVADKLFKKTNIDARYMLDSIELEEQTSLSTEEKLHLQNEITLRHQRESIDIPNWEQRYESFLIEKQTVLNSSMAVEDKRQYMASLLDQHFSKEEISQVRFMRLEYF